ncbi:MAG TPA: pyridoxamine 5'-phosphate oxidase family protein [Stellaceae bacterium]|nr:pyridoxamine 5'-phosphate oxidase family protein [Stellaceae bacterium]
MIPLPGWSFPDSPFHPGEQQVQQRLGVRERMEAVGRRVLRNVMPDQHRAFFAALPFLVLGTVDGEGWPWASIAAGAPGFLSTPDARTLRVAAAPPLGAHLADGGDIGALGIDFAARRRNRANGLVRAPGAGGFDIAVAQSFGNCPRYIQARDWSLAEGEAAAPGAARRGRWLGAAERALIAGADTFFIASALGSAEGAPSHGVDVSHRGGPPGFVRVDDEHAMSVPDFTGNSYYNTLGNLVLNPRCGLLFIDFDSGGIVQVAATAEIVWEGPEVARFAGAQRVLRFHVEERVTAERAVPLRWRLRDYSPFLAALGSWGPPPGAA